MTNCKSINMKRNLCILLYYDYVFQKLDIIIILAIIGTGFEFSGFSFFFGFLDDRIPSSFPFFTQIQSSTFGISHEGKSGHAGVSQQSSDGSTNVGGHGFISSGDFRSTDAKTETQYKDENPEESANEGSAEWNITTI